MHVVVVCTTDTIRAPALAHILTRLRPDLAVRSAAVGANAQPGRRMTRPMRIRMQETGYGDFAERHRSIRYDQLGAPRPDLVVCCAPVHARHMERIDPSRRLLKLDPPIPDPVFSGEAGYERCWNELLNHAYKLARNLPRPARSR